MIPSVRQRYNQLFTIGKYEDFLADLNGSYNFKIKFRVAETPIFIPRPFKEKLIQASDEIIGFLVRNDFKTLTENAIPKGFCSALANRKTWSFWKLIPTNKTRPSISLLLNSSRASVPSTWAM